RLAWTALMVSIFLPCGAGSVHAQEDGGLSHQIDESVLDSASLHETSSGLPQFDPTWFASQLFWLLVAFGVLYLFFSKRTLPDLSSIIENRKNHIKADLDQAEELTTQAETVQSHYEQSLQGARNQAAV